MEQHGIIIYDPAGDMVFAAGDWSKDQWGCVGAGTSYS